MIKNLGVHVWITLSFALIHFLIWLAVLWQELEHALGGLYWARSSGQAYAPSPLYTVLSFPAILLPSPWLIGIPGIALFVLNSLLWGIMFDVVVALIWRGVSSLVSRRHPAVQTKEE